MKSNVIGKLWLLNGFLRRNVHFRESVAIDDGDFTRMVSKVEWTPQLPLLTASYGTGQDLQAMLDNGSKPSPEG
uniref:Neur_chan_LBD domain-containing protein n=1 Tax=Angiostrongylus cantonensis TaxID=6313 RepID=A0A0K0D8B6_ANGCA